MENLRFSIDIFLLCCNIGLYMKPYICKLESVLDMI